MGSSGTGATTAFDVDYITVELPSTIEWTYTYTGDAAVAGPNDFLDSLDGLWDHNNGSDQWDGSAPGTAAPAIAGGVGSYTEGEVTFLRIQDTGDPRDFPTNASDPSNRKIYFGSPVDAGLDGAMLEFSMRIATTGTLDPVFPDGGGFAFWPPEGIGAKIGDSGKGMIGIAQAEAGILSFSLAQAEELVGIPGFEDVTTDVLLLNNLVDANAPSGDVDTTDEADTILARNWVPVEDATQWNTFMVKIKSVVDSTYAVKVYVNGEAAGPFDVTAGSGLEYEDGAFSYLAMGSSSTGVTTAFDVDYLSYKAP